MTLSRLESTLPTASLVTDAEVLVTYREDRSRFTVPGTPAAAVIARSVEDVQATLSYADATGTPVVVRGAGSGLSGGANAVDGCLVLVTAQMATILDIDRAGLRAEVEPGVITGDLKRAAAGVGLFYPPDPASASFSSIGGNVATNAGGLCCVKYGVTRDYVMALTAVLPDGSLLQTGSLTRKSSAGYDLTGLMVGSEGTLGVVVGATLRLISAPPPAATLVATFPSLEGAARLAAELAAEGVVPSLLEVMDRTTIQAVETFAPMGLDRELATLVIAQSDSLAARDDMIRMTGIARGLGAAEVYHSDDPAEADMLLQARRVAFTALETGDHVTMLDDVAVPLSRVAEMVTAIDEIAAGYGVDIATFGHLGDGNLHPTIRFAPNDDHQASSAESAFEAILDLALAVGGTVTGEHGVGALKTSALGRQLGPASQRLHRLIKRSFDPRDLLNPTKALPAAEEPS